MRLTTVASCTLDQWALDFDGNVKRIVASIKEAIGKGARYRLGPELEVCGYSCEDHFYEPDTHTHSWEALVEIITQLESDPQLSLENVILDIGMPVIHRNCTYNCRIYIHQREILLIRPKIFLADDGNYRECRWFTAWTRRREIIKYTLPVIAMKFFGQRDVHFGDGVIRSADGVLIATESCEELFTPDSPHIMLGLNGVDIISNGSGSHHTLRKLNQRVDLIHSAASKVGGVYMYANHQGCDGTRLYFDGSSLIAHNNKFLSQGTQFSLKDLEVIIATVDLDETQAYRAGIKSRCVQADVAPEYPIIDCSANLIIDESDGSWGTYTPTPPREIFYHDPMEEIAMGPACWLWDYLRRSGQAGFFVPLSGGADSCSVVAIVGSMCQMVVKAIEDGDEQVLADMLRITGQPPTYRPETSLSLASLLLHTAYLGTPHSSSATRRRAQQIASEVGAYHLSLDIEGVVGGVVGWFRGVTGRTPLFGSEGGGVRESLARQNIQARLRMVLSYMLAQLLCWVRGRDGGLLVLGTSNVDECLRGYYTKYDCSAADLNPIGAISKTDLKSFMHWAATHLHYPTLAEVSQAPPTAELEPITETYTQTDEADMGMTYEELSYYGRLRKLAKCGPVSMFRKLTDLWQNRQLSAREIAAKVKHFFRSYSINRHKTTTLTPSYHCENYSPDDNRYDLRPFLMDVRWPWQFRKIDELVEERERRERECEERESIV